MPNVQTAHAVSYTRSRAILQIRRKRITDQLQHDTQLGAREMEQLTEELERIDIELQTMASTSDLQDRHQVEEEEPEEDVLKLRIAAYNRAIADQAWTESRIATLKEHMKPAETKVTPSYEESTADGSDARFSKVEEAVLKPYKLLEKLEARSYTNFAIITEMEIAMFELSEYEQEIIRAKYMVTDRQKQKDIAIYTKMEISRQRFYRLCRSGIKKLKRALGI